MNRLRGIHIFEIAVLQSRIVSRFTPIHGSQSSKGGFQIGPADVISKHVSLQFWKCGFHIVGVKNAIVDCRLTIDAVKPTIDVRRLTTDAVLAAFGRVEQRFVTVSY